MEKLKMCRICLADNVRMYVVVNKNLQELYEKLVGVPFVTEDKRPILACYFCCAKLKQCFRLMRKCLEAEELLAQMMDEDCELNPFISREQLVFCGGFVKTPSVLTSTSEEFKTGSIAINEKVLAVCEIQDDIQSHNRNHNNDVQSENVDISYEQVPGLTLYYSGSDSEPDAPFKGFRTEVEEALEVPKKSQRAVETSNVSSGSGDNGYLAVRDIHTHRADSDSEGDVPYMEVTIKVEELPEVYDKKRRSVESNNLDLDNTYLGVEDVPPHHSESDFEVNIPLLGITTAVKEALKVPKRRRVVESNRVRVTRRTKLKDTDAAELNKNEQLDLNVSRTTRNRPSKPNSIFKVPEKGDQRSLKSVKKLNQDSQTRICEKPFKCDFCERIFSDKNKLAIHNRTHTGERPYKCNVCHRGFSQSSHLTKHIRIHTGEKPYKCHVCQRSFSVKGSLTEHIRIHTGEKPYKCDICQRSFSQKINLTNHIRVHTGEKPYKCDICQRSFSQKTPLTNHFIIHTGEKPYKCDVCQRSFNGKSTLAKHSRIHTGIRPFKCDVCEHSFTQKINLTQHIRIHTGEKPFKCDTCQRSFSQKIHLNKHLRIHSCATN